jgi:hypothetical protein
MSVMAETPQSAIAPYVAVAEVGLALYALSAVLSSSLLVKVRGQVPVAQFPLYSCVCFQTGKPTHAQRISSLFSADKECELCRVGKDGVCETRGEPHQTGRCGVDTQEWVWWGGGPRRELASSVQGGGGLDLSRCE